MYIVKLNSDLEHNNASWPEDYGEAKASAVSSVGPGPRSETMIADCHDTGCLVSRLTHGAELRKRSLKICQNEDSITVTQTVSAEENPKATIYLDCKSHIQIEINIAILAHTVQIIIYIYIYIPIFISFGKILRFG